MDCDLHVTVSSKNTVALWNQLGLSKSPQVNLFNLPGGDETKGRLKPLPQLSVQRGWGGDKNGLKRILIQVVQGVGDLDRT